MPKKKKIDNPALAQGNPHQTLNILALWPNLGSDELCWINLGKIGTSGKEYNAGKIGKLSGKVSRPSRGKSNSLSTQSLAY